MDCSVPGFPVLCHLPEFAQIHVHWVGDAIQPSRPLSSPSPALNLSQHQGLFHWVGFSHNTIKYWSFNFSISPSSEYLELLSFRTDWFDLLAVQGTLKTLLQHHNLKALILWVQPSLLSPFYKWGNWELEKLNKLPIIICLIFGGIGMQTWIF